MAGATWKVLFQLMGGVSTENSQNFESMEFGTHDKPCQLQICQWVSTEAMENEFATDCSCSVSD